MSSKGRYQRDYPEQPRKSGKGLKIALIVVSVVLVLVIAAGACGVIYVNSMLNRVNKAQGSENSLSQEELDEILGYNPDATAESFVPVQTTEATEVTEAPTETKPQYEPGKSIVNVLVVGQAYREGEETKLADSTILLSMNRRTKTLTMTSFLRDMYIQLPNYKGHTCGMQRINVCYNLGWKWGGDLGAMEMMNLCLKNNFGIEVDHNIEVNFDVFPKIIDMMGGVSIELTEAEVEYLTAPGFNGINDYVKVGENTLNGDTALAYARARKLDGDVQRSNRQRKIIASLLQSAKSMSLGDLNRMAKDILPMITTNMTNEEMAGYLLEFLPMLKDLKIESGVCPAEGTFWGETVDIGGYPSNVLKFDLQKNAKILQAIAEEPVEETEPAA